LFRCMGPPFSDRPVTWRTDRGATGEVNNGLLWKGCPGRGLCGSPGRLPARGGGSGERGTRERRGGGDPQGALRAAVGQRAGEHRTEGESTVVGGEQPRERTRGGPGWGQRLDGDISGHE